MEAGRRRPMEKEIKIKVQYYEAERIVQILEEVLKLKYMSVSDDQLIAKVMEQISVQL
jgi:hypothetical protein